MQKIYDKEHCLSHQVANLCLDDIKDKILPLVMSLELVAAVLHFHYV